MDKKDSQLEKLGNILEKSLKRLDPSDSLVEYGVWPIWNEIVGPTIARNAQPDKIRHGTLFVKVTSPTWMQQLQYMKEMISEKLNQSLGAEVVKNIFFYVGRLEPEVPASRTKDHPAPSLSSSEPKIDEEHLSSIKDPEIRRALRRLFAAKSADAKAGEQGDQCQPPEKSQDRGACLLFVQQDNDARHQADVVQGRTA